MLHGEILFYIWRPERFKGTPYRENRRLRPLPRLRKQEPHRENSSDCLPNALAAKGSPAPSKKLDYFSPHSLHNTEAGGVPDVDLDCGSSASSRHFLLQDLSPTTRSKSRLLFSCPSFSTQDNGFLEISPSRPSVFDNATPPDSSCFVNAHGVVLSSGQFNYTGLRFPVPPRLNIPVWRALLQGYEDRVICDFLEFGWPLGYTNQTLPVFELRTHRGALTFPSLRSRIYQQRNFPRSPGRTFR